MSFNAPTLTDKARAEAAIRLGKIEGEEGVTVLFAVESGSRAWGFPSPDSDFDVRFVFARPLSQYLELKTHKDVIRRPIVDDWDLEGWDIRKALDLMTRGNATICEWLQSPLLYREFGPFPYRLRDLMKRHASVDRSARHYYGLTKTCFQSEIGNRPTADVAREALEIGATIKGPTEVSYKKYLYALRGAASISWIARYGEIPPMTLPALMSATAVPEDVRGVVEHLLERKATMSELGQGLRLPLLDSFITHWLEWAKARIKDDLPDDPQLFEESNKLLLESLGV